MLHDVLMPPLSNALRQALGVLCGLLTEMRNAALEAIVQLAILAVSRSGQR